MNKEDLSALEDKYGLPSGMLYAQMMKESGGDPSAVSPKGALGLFQFMPKTAEQYGIDPMDESQAAEGAARMNSDLLNKYGDVGTALAAYNWGQGNVDRKGIENAPQETRGYVSGILSSLGDAAIPSAQAAEPDDYSSMSDEDLLRLADESGIQTYLSMSDDDLIQAAKEQGIDVPPRQKTDQGGEDEKLIRAREAIHGGDSTLAKLTSYGANALAEIPFMKEIGSAGAALAGAGEGATFGQRYQDLMKSQAAMREAGKDVSGVDVGQVSGNVLGLGLGGAVIGGAASKLAPKATSGLAEWAAKNPKMADLLSGGAINALYGAAQADEDRGKSALESGIVGGALSVPLGVAGRAAAPYISKGLSSTVAKMKGEDIDVLSPVAAKAMNATAELKPPSITSATTSEELRRMASPLYKEATDAGAVLKPEFTDDFLKSAKESITEPESVTKAFGNTAPNKIINGIEKEFAGKPMTFEEATAINKRLNQEINSQVLPNGKLNAEGQQLFDMQTKLRERLNSAEKNGMVDGDASGIQAWKQANDLWKKSAQMADIERIFDKAETMDNPATSVRQGFRTIYNNKKRLSSFPPEAQEMIKKMTKANIPMEMLRAMGSRLTTISAGTLGLASGGPLGALGGYAASSAIGEASRKLAMNMEKNRSQALKDTILGLSKKTTGANMTAAQLSEFVRKQYKDDNNTGAKSR